jgi:hypothetical protein
MKAATATVGAIAWRRASAGLAVRPDRDTIVALEAVFFRGWLLLRFEAAFGLVPGLLLSALATAPITSPMA